MTRTTQVRRGLLGLAGAAMVAAMVPLAGPASAAGVTKVKTEAQLRAAVAQANASPGADRIQLAANIVFANAGDLDVTDDLSVDGRGRTIDAAGLDRIFDVTAGTSLDLRSIRLTGGAPADGESGGAVRSAGTVRVTNAVLTGNVVTGTGASGGALLNDGGVLTVTTSILSENTATRAGGAIEAVAGETTVRSSVLSDNSTGAAPGNGGAVHLTGAGTVVVRSSEVSGNHAAAEGGGLWNSATGTFTVQSSRIKGNTAAGNAADQGGGGLFNDGGAFLVVSSVVEDNEATGTSGSGGGLLNNLGTATVRNSRFSGNSAPRAGGGIEANVGSTTLRNVELVGNDTGAAPGNGGGLHLTGAGTVEVSNALVEGNTASAEGGGLWNSASGTFSITNSLIRGNVASGAGADQGGGGLFNDGNEAGGGTMTVRNSRIEGNAADGLSGSGGGVLNDEGSLTVSSSIINDNTAKRAGGGLEANVGTTTLDTVVMNQNSTGDNPGNGGAVHLSGAGTVTWDRGWVTGNHAGKEGGGVWNSAPGTMTLTNLYFADNTAVVIGNEGNGVDVFWQLPATGTFLLNGSPVAAG